MKNLSYFPYERNHYYYGKLLSAEDFEAEQRYMNDKRRLINRFMHGCGVVCGLTVVQVGDDTVSVEPGLALDFAGREIVVDEPVTRRLSELPGFSDYEDDGENSGYLYLCIEYAEYEREKAYSLADSDGEAYDRIAEGCRLFLTAQEPEQGISGSASCYERRRTLYWGNGVRITQVFPRFARSGREFDARIVVENMGQKQPVFFRYELELTGMKAGENSRALVAFDETEYGKARRYELPLTFTAASADHTRGSAAVLPESFVLRVGNEPVSASVSCESEVEIVEEPVATALERWYFANAMREIQKESYHQSIYLAKISLFEAGEAVIDDVEELPFDQYICSDVLSGLRELAAKQEQSALLRRIERNRQAVVERPVKETKKEPCRMAFGTVELSLGMGGLSGRRFRSKPILHGLGPGAVTVVLGMADRPKPGALYYGEPEVFGEFVCEVQGKLAAKVDVEAGTLEIGIRLTETTSAESVRINWAVFRDPNEPVETRKERTLFLKPDMVYLRPREDISFETVGGRDEALEWSTTGGSVDNGRYTAPGEPGIYQVTARSRRYSTIAAAYVVVREEGG